jgi:TPR repeat protein
MHATLLSAATAICLVTPTSDAEVRGTVSQVRDDIVVIKFDKFEGVIKPKLGDQIDILVVAPGGGETKVATAHVVTVIQTSVVARVSSVTGKVAVGQIASFAVRRASTSSKPWLGVSRIAVNGNEVMLCWVLSDGPAGYARLQPYDTIVSIGRKPIKHLGAFHATIDAFEPGDYVIIEYRRAGEVKEALVTLKPLPADGGTSKFLKAAEAGNTLAQVEMGVRYANLRGPRSYCEKNEQKAIMWFRRAHERGDPWGSYFLATMYIAGSSTKPDYAQARQLLEKILSHQRAESLHGLRTHARVRLGKMYEAGQGVPRDLDQAQRYYGAASEQGSLVGQYMLGQLYERQRKKREALHAYSEAARGGYPVAIYMMGQIHLTGKLAERDERQALMWFQIGANSDSKTSMYQLARMYEEGIGTKSNLNEALHWYRKAAALGSPDARKKLDDLD